MNEDSPFEPARDACETVRDLIKTCDGWEIAEDALEAMAAVGLLERIVDKLDGRRARVLSADDGRLDAALDALRPADRPEIVSA